ncbi:putative cytochrome P450 [Astrocystis sublimbata]|nr:putative cytochrome P450 [Astrocystis sublimbata]
MLSCMVGIQLMCAAIYRFWLHPLSKFPGPKIAAFTTLYEAYFDLIHKGGGQFAFKIKQLHQKYGPIVRIGPNEVHIDDASFYNEVYSNHTAARPIDKLEKYRHRFGMPEALISTVDGETHRIRRTAISGFFSKQHITSLNKTAQDVVMRISNRLSSEYRGTGKVINACEMWAALTADVVSELAFARQTHFSDAPDFQSSYSQAMMSWVFAAHLTTHFNFLMQMIHWIPDSIMSLILPSLTPVLRYRQVIRQQVKDVLAGDNIEAEKAAHRTIFSDILTSGLPEKELSERRLTQEAMSVSGAGIETTMWTLSLTTFHILWNPAIESRLVTELVQAMPDPTSPTLPWAQLERLPFLTAVILEGLRLSFGSVQRLPRVSRQADIQFRSWRIPAGSAVSMDAYHMHSNPGIFPSPNDFDPDRWLGNPRGPDNVHPLSFYLVSFARGSRGCLGQHLAMMDMYVALATLFRRHKLQLFETDRGDVDFQVDLVRPMPKWGSKGIRFIVLDTADA